MFVQVIEGRVADADRLRQKLDEWNEKLRPGATGFLGSTAGVTDDGRAICFARFESADAAQANSDRPEQGQWWAETESCFDGDVSFSNSDDVDTFLAGGSNDAGFVQVMKSHDVDREQVEALDKEFRDVAATVRPDVIGGTRGVDRAGHVHRGDLLHERGGGPRGREQGDAPGVRRAGSRVRGDDEEHRVHRPPPTLAVLTVPGRRRSRFCGTVDNQIFWSMLRRATASRLRADR